MHSLNEQMDTDWTFNRSNNGLMAEWLGRGLQNLVQRFESASDLKKPFYTAVWKGFSFFTPFFTPLLQHRDLFSKGFSLIISAQHVLENPWLTGLRSSANRGLKDSAQRAYGRRRAENTPEQRRCPQNSLVGNRHLPPRP